MERVTLYLQKHVVAKTSELQKFIKNRMAVARLVESGLIQSPMRGYYCLPNVDVFQASLVIVSKYFEEAVVSGVAAAKYYDLTDENVERIDVDIPNSLNVQNSFLRVKRVSLQKLIGVNSITLLKHKIKIYDEERTLIDLKLKYPRSVFYKSLKRYVKAGKINSGRIKEYDELCSTNVLTSLMQELADD